MGYAYYNLKSVSTLYIIKDLIGQQDDASLSDQLNLKLTVGASLIVDA